VAGERRSQDISNIEARKMVQKEDTKGYIYIYIYIYILGGGVGEPSHIERVEQKLHAKTILNAALVSALLGIVVIVQQHYCCCCCTAFNNACTHMLAHTYN